MKKYHVIFFVLVISTLLVPTVNVDAQEDVDDEFDLYIYGAYSGYNDLRLTVHGNGTYTNETQGLKYTVINLETNEEKSFIADFKANSTELVVGDFSFDLVQTGVRDPDYRPPGLSVYSIYDFEGNSYDAPTQPSDVPTEWFQPRSEIVEDKVVVYDTIENIKLLTYDPKTGSTSDVEEFIHNFGPSDLGDNWNRDRNGIFVPSMIGNTAAFYSWYQYINDDLIARSYVFHEYNVDTGSSSSTLYEYNYICNTTQYDVCDFEADLIDKTVSQFKIPNSDDLNNVIFSFNDKPDVILNISQSQNVQRYSHFDTDVENDRVFLTARANLFNDTHYLGANLTTIMIDYNADGANQTDVYMELYQLIPVGDWFQVSFNLNFDFEGYRMVTIYTNGSIFITYKLMFADIFNPPEETITPETSSSTSMTENNETTSGSTGVDEENSTPLELNATFISFFGLIGIIWMQKFRAKSR